MSSGPKDSKEVITFMVLFADIKDWTGDIPEDLVAFAEEDESARDLCIRLADAANQLRSRERSERQLFAAPVDPKFTAAWRDYEERYSGPVGEVCLAGLWELFDPDDSSSSSDPDRRWDIADAEARRQAKGVEDAIGFAARNLEDEGRHDALGEDFVNDIYAGIAVWDRLADEAGFDLRGVFRRRALIPFVLVPRKVAARHGSAEKLSLLKNLQQAHEAFVYGAGYAAVALMRSIAEAVLRDHYRVDGRDLSERIRNARSRLPPGASEAALHRLRRHANAILHLDPQTGRDLSAIDERELEKQIISLLLVLRSLIEGVR